jgi:tetratricopeptide (TPR) repeat protein
MTNEGFKLIACVVLLPLSVSLIPPVMAQVQSDTAQAVKSDSYLPLPTGVFHGSLPGKPGSGPTEAEIEYNDAILQGNTFLKAGNTQAALRSFELAMDYLPSDPLALQKIAETYATTGRTVEAAKTYHRLFYDAKWQSVGANPTVYLGYAVILAKTGNPAEAMKFYQEGVRRVNHMGGKQNLKVLLPELVEERLLSEQVRYTPERLQALADTALAHEELGFGSDKEAIAHMQEAVKLFPDSPVTHFYLGEALSRKDQARARAAYRKAAELGDARTRVVVNERLGTAK